MLQNMLPVVNAGDRSIYKYMDHAVTDDHALFTIQLIVWK